ncbi:F-box DNA helicase 1-like isoform X2 [Lingula anatina]|uniref:F-box DNA helicase 1-like isoform X2 n=1 Tax=Lingula anatina TaxID=7574 RepID=A0A1S3IQB6_LINAN|nr:F-box DNA helicase 1-like isoform X2 [Lingula anatina]|eukprot:XP_013400415.1 F-box DNA helicase 1-like isoform X2 [Lingula anatina]
MSEQTSAVPTSGETQAAKRRKVQLTTAQCQERSSSEEGAIPLTNPAAVKTSSKDPNRGLYPRSRANKTKSRMPENESSKINLEMTAQYNGFQPAGYQYTLNRSPKQSPGKRHIIQKNKLTNYFSSTKPEFSECIGADNTEDAPVQCTPPQSITSSSENSVPSTSKASISDECIGVRFKEDGTLKFTPLDSIPTSHSSSPSFTKIREFGGIKGANQSEDAPLQCTPPHSIKTSLQNLSSSSKGSSPSSSQTRKTCVMYSPLKKLENGTYVCEKSPVNATTSKTTLWPTLALDDDSSDFEKKGATSFSTQRKNFSRNIFDDDSNDFDCNSATVFSSQRNGFSRSTNTATKVDPQKGEKTSVDEKQRYETVGNLSDKYGLLGTGEVDLTGDETDSDKDYFSMLPIEVIENILCQLPMLDLALNVNRVCSQWNDIISDERFVPWKKMYHKLKKDDEKAIQFTKNLLVEGNMKTIPDLLMGLIRHLKDHKPVTVRVNTMSECLRRHTKYECAEDLLKERLEDCIVDGVPNPWSLITMLVIISETVHDIEEVIECLLCAHSQCTANEVVECLYHIAVILLAFKKNFSTGPWNGILYRLYYALYLHENSTTSNMLDLTGVFEKSKGQQSLLKYGKATGLKMTHEQQRIINHNVARGDVLKIIAFAGTGKTSTLIRYTQFRPSTSFVLVVYNKAVSDRNKSAFPSNVNSTTGHALAFRSFGVKYKSKLGDVKVSHLLDFLPNLKGFNSFLRCKAVRDTINTFMNSADPFITTAHVPLTEMGKNGQPKDIDHEKKMQYSQDASKAWEVMKNVSNCQLNMPHDGYLKLFQLSRVPEKVLSKYDCILIDEAQDLTPAIADLLLRQPQAKILVGDPHQQIYAFRGAVNSMRQVENTHTFYLTQSFRFGPEIAYVANCVLEHLKKEKTKTLVGSGVPGGVYGDQEGQLAILCRCNYTVFNEATKKCCYTDKNLKVAFVGGTDGFGFPFLMEIYAMLLSEEQRKKENRAIKNRLLQKFLKQPCPFGALEKFAENVEDADLLGKIKIVKTFHHRLPNIVDKILSKTVGDLRLADVVFSTAHKSKGLEFSTVQLTDDFLINSDGQTVEHKEDECNILYVAVTRAKKRLQMNEILMKHVLRHLGEQFEYPVSSKSLEKDGASIKCMYTDQVFKPNAATLVRRTVKIDGGRVTLDGGMHSPVVVHQNYPAWRELLGTPGSGEDTSSQDSDYQYIMDEDMVDAMVGWFM